MKAAIVRGAGQGPVYGDFVEPVATVAEHRVAVSAAAISHVVKSRASGRHYGSAGQLPVRRRDRRRGPARRRDAGSFFCCRVRPIGSMAERTGVPGSGACPCPMVSMT